MATTKEVRLKYRILVEEKPDPRDSKKMGVWKRELELLREWLRSHSERKKERL